MKSLGTFPTIFPWTHSCSKKKLGLVKKKSYEMPFGYLSYWWNTQVGFLHSKWFFIKVYRDVSIWQLSYVYQYSPNIYQYSQSIYILKYVFIIHYLSFIFSLYYRQGIDFLCIRAGRWDIYEIYFRIAKGSLELFSTKRQNC